MFLENVKKESKDLVFALTTCSSQDEAREIGLASINAKLAISADYWHVESIYPWRGVIQEQVNQYMLMLSTQKSLASKLTDFIDKMHSYSTPMIAVCDSSLVNPEYKFWMDNLLGNNRSYITRAEADIKKVEDEEGVYHYGKLK